MTEGTITGCKGLMLVFVLDLQIIVTTETDPVPRLDSEIGVVT
jgi:hypothetical protein